MRIGIVTEYSRPWPGGISEHVHHEAEALRARGHQVCVLTGGAAILQSADARTTRAEPHTQPLRVGRALTFASNGARSRLTLGPFLWRMRRLLTQLAPDVLHVHAPLDPFLPLMAALCAPCPVIGTFHASFQRSPLFDLIYAQNPLARRAWRRMHTRIAVSREAQRSVEQYFPGAYRLLPNGVDLARFAAHAPRPRAPGQAPARVLFVGRPDPRKGLPLLLAAHALLIARGVDSELVLCGVSGAEAEPLLRALGPDARRRVRALGYVAPDQLPNEYANAALLCSPATAGESQGVVLLEAMASGRPCVCFDIPGYREVVTHEHDGLLVNERSAAALARALERLLRDSPLRQRLGAQAATTARGYAWPRIADALEAVFLEACAGCAHAAAVPRAQAC